MIIAKEKRLQEVASASPRAARQFGREEVMKVLD